MEKIQCDKCGADNNSSSKYCSNCGYELPKIEHENSITAPVKPKRKPMAQIIGMVVGAVLAASLSTAVVNKVFFNKPTIDKVLIKMAGEMNKTLPMMLDSDTRLDNVMALPNKTVMYSYTLVNGENGMIDTIALKNYLEPNIINTIKTDPGMKYFRENSITQQYRYKDKNGNYLFSIVATPEQYK